MSLGGPRLDRPSAIGDEGRPRATSLGIATLAVVALGLAAGYAMDQPLLVTELGFVVGSTVAGIALLDRTRFAELVVGHALVVLFGAGLGALVLLAPFFDWGGVTVTGLTIALFGIAIAWADVDGDGLKRGFGGCGLTYGALLGTIVAILVLVGSLLVARELLESIVSTSTPAGSLAGFAVVVIATGSLCLLSLRWLPVRALTPRNRRHRIERRLEAVRRALVLIVAGGAALVAVTAALVASGLLALASRVPALETAIAGLSAAVVVWPLVGLGLVSAFAGGIAASLRALTRRFDTGATRRLAAVTAGFLTLGVGIVAVLSIGELAIVLLVFGPLAFLFLVGVLLVGRALALVPDRAGGPAIAASGLVIAAIGLGWDHSILAFACLAGAGLVWDVSTYGLGLTAELGHIPETRRLELFHGVLSVGVAVSAVVVVAGLESLRTGAFADVGGSGALVALGLGALLLLLPLRG